MRFFKTTALFAANILCHAVAQGTNATCLPQYDWMTNARGQSPCLVAGYLLSNFVQSLPENTFYAPADASNRVCNTVLYAVMSACETCQGRFGLSWSMWNWKANCHVSYTIWPEIIPPDTSIPRWAYLDVVTPDTFNVTAAEAIAAKGAPDSSAAPSATSSATDSFSSSFVPTPTLTPSGPVSLGIGSTNTPADTNNRNASASSSKKSNVGAIVGGVLGGIGGVAILATVAFALFRRRKYARVANAGPLHVDDDISWGNDIDHPPSDNAHFGQHVQSPSDDVVRPFDHPGGVPEFLRQTAHIVEQTQSPSFDIGYLSYYSPRVAPQLPPRVDEQAQLIPDDIGLSRTSYHPDVISAHFVERAATPFEISRLSHPTGITPESSPRTSRPGQRAQSPFSDARHLSYHPLSDAPELAPRTTSFDVNEDQTPSDPPRQSQDSDLSPPRRRSPPSLSSYGSTASLTIRSFSTGLPRYKSKDSLPKWSPAPPMRMQDLSGSSPPVARQIRRLPPIPAVQSMVLPSVGDAGPSSRLTV